MKIRIKDGIIYAIQEGVDEKAIGSMFPTSTFQEERIIECGSDVLPVVEDFIKEVNSGTLKPKKATDRFEAILKAHAV